MLYIIYFVIQPHIPCFYKKHSTNVCAFPLFSARPIMSQLAHHHRSCLYCTSWYLWLPWSFHLGDFYCNGSSTSGVYFVFGNFFCWTSFWVLPELSSLLYVADAGWGRIETAWLGCHPLIWQGFQTFLMLVNCHIGCCFRSFQNWLMLYK